MEYCISNKCLNGACCKYGSAVVEEIKSVTRSKLASITGQTQLRDVALLGGLRRWHDAIGLAKLAVGDYLAADGLRARIRRVPGRLLVIWPGAAGQPGR